MSIVLKRVQPSSSTMRQYTKETGCRTSARVTESKFGRMELNMSATGEATSLKIKAGSSYRTEAIMRVSGKILEPKARESTTTYRLG